MAEAKKGLSKAEADAMYVAPSPPIKIVLTCRIALRAINKSRRFFVFLESYATGYTPSLSAVWSFASPR